MAIRVQVKEIKQITFTDADIIDAENVGEVSLEGLSKHTRQLNLRKSKPSFTAENIKHLTHLFVDTVTPQMEIPETLEHLFVHNQKKGPWPTVKNLYIEEQDLRAFLQHETRERFYVFAWIGCILNEYMILADKYTIGPERVIAVFGGTYHYRELTLKHEPVATPAPAITSQTRLTRDELIELNTQNLASKYTNLPQEIYNEVHAACLRGEGWAYERIIQYSYVSEAESVKEFLVTELEGFNIECEGVELRITL